MSLDMLTLYKSWRDVPNDGWRWPHFTAKEMSCKCHRYCTGQYLHDPVFLDKLEAVRGKVFAQTGLPMDVNSGTRCPLHNAAEGGSTLSMHKAMNFKGRGAASDLGVLRWNDLQKAILLTAAFQVGFGGYGYGLTFLHLDNRALKPNGRAAHWDYAKGGMARWTSLIS